MSCQIPPEPLVLCLIHIVESHLELAYSRRQSRSRLFIFAVFYAWCSQYAWYLR